MTPTFATGLGVVIAAGLASNFSGSLLRYPTVPDTGMPCAVPACGSGKGSPASARPGKRLLPPVHSPAPPVRPSGHHTSAARATAAAQGVVVMYQTLHEDGYGGFSGYILITSRTGQPLGNWTFQFTYPSGQITGVWAGTPVSHGAHSATVTAAQAGAAGAGARQAQIVFTVSGPAGPPAGCSFDGRACQYTVSQGSVGGFGGGGSQGPGGSEGGRQG